jgi:outer membrane protein insertion porin family
MKKLFLAAALSCAISHAYAFAPFRIQDIRLDGLERISAGTVFTYLPIEKGDLIDNQRAADAIRALFKTGFFSDVTLDRQGDILVVKLIERPAISSITLKGNKDIKTEDLIKALGNIGLVEGEVFNRVNLDRVKQELTRQYYNRGKYSVAIKADVVDLERNRVDITIDIKEGKAAKIKHINIVGNTAFSDDELKSAFKQSETNWTSWYSSDDQYSREKFTGDLETLRSFYLDRGYVDFNLETSQVSISPDKRAMYITANVREGEVYKIADVALAGTFPVAESDLRRLLFVKEGDTFSRKQLENTSEAMQKVMANLGYAFAEVTPVPEVNRENRTVKLTFMVNPGNRVYVRRINFVGNLKTRDEVLRREMRQFEGGWFNQSSLDLSKARMMRLGYFKEVNIETPKVAGTDDQVDVTVKVEERTAGTFQFGFGYSAIQGLILSVSLNQDNFLGTGNRIGFTVNNSSVYKRFDISYFDPYYTDDGIARGFNFSYRTFDRGEANIANFTSDNLTFSNIWSIPVTETDRISASLALDWTKINVFRDNSETGMGAIDRSITPEDIARFIEINGSKYFALRANVGWSRDTRNHYFAPTAGMFQQAFAEIALPTSDLHFYKLYYANNYYWPITRTFTLLFRGELAYGAGYGDGNDDGRTDGLPFFENYYSGGPGSIRGYNDNTVGPREPPRFPGDTPGAYLGGALKVVGGLELIFPNPIEKARDSTQFSAFVDFGQVYRDSSDFEAREFRFSTGLALKWLAPVGPIQISIAKPFNTDRFDETETLQFTFGNQF